MPNKQNLVNFKKNDPVTGEKDPRINRKGRAIRGKDALRKEWEQIWSEILFDANGKPIIDEVTGKALTRLRGRMRTMTTSRNVKELELALAYTYGKPKDELDLTTGGEKLTIEIIRASNDKESPENK